MTLNRSFPTASTNANIEKRKVSGRSAISFFNSSFQTTLKDGWAAKPVIYPKSPGDVAKTWASGYKMPLHYKNPVTGK